MQVKPIWEDTTLTVSADLSPFEYSIEIAGDPATVVFRGKAYAAPAESAITVSISKIAQDYLSINFPDLIDGDETIHEDAYKVFVVRDGNGDVVDTVAFLLDWSYRPTTIQSGMTLSDPINDRTASGMWLFTTSLEDGEVITSTELSDSEECGDYAVYYLNRSGGYDSLLLRGTVKKTDSYDRYSINRHYQANSLQFGKKTYNNQITTRYEANTGWFNDRESDNFAFNFLSSNQVFLHDLRSGEITPVVVTDAEAEYKTFKNNGRKMVNYRFTVESSQTKSNIS